MQPHYLPQPNPFFLLKRTDGLGQTIKSNVADALGLSCCGGVHQTGMDISKSLQQIHSKNCTEFVHYIHILQDSVQAFTLPQRNPNNSHTWSNKHSWKFVPFLCQQLPLHKATWCCIYIIPQCWVVFCLLFPIEVFEAEHYIPPAFLDSDPDLLHLGRTQKLVLLQSLHECVQSAFSRPKPA